MRVVIDSMKGDSTTPIPAAVLDSARGAVPGVRQPRGQAAPLTPTGTSPAAAQVQGLLSDFFPWVRAGFKVGEAWADTVGQHHRRRRPTRSPSAESPTTGGGQRDPGGRRAVRITDRSHLEGRGHPADPAGPAQIEGTGNGKGSYFVSPDGRYLGGEWELHSALTLTGAFAKQPVPDHPSPDHQGHGGPMRRR